MAKGCAVSPVLSAEDLTLGYGAEPVVRDLRLEVGDGDFTVIVGPNGCGKSTLLKALGRVNKPMSGRVLLRGRFPHHTLVRQWSPQDETAIRSALELTGLADLADTQVGSLSGGQRQRAWVAMVLAQDTGILLLDEPTTYLDIAHQYDLLELFADLHRQGRTVVAVLHDLAQAARFATRLVLMDRGRVVADGPPEQVVTARMVEEVFGLACDVVPDPRTRTPLVIPHERAPSRPR
jgi:iron complex transport system ATP-binding protein